MNGKTLFQLHKKNQIAPLSKPTTEENATEVCADLPQSMDDILQLIKDQVLSGKPEQFKTTGKYGTEY